MYIHDINCAKLPEMQQEININFINAQVFLANKGEGISQPYSCLYPAVIGLVDAVN